MSESDMPSSIAARIATLLLVGEAHLRHSTLVYLCCQSAWVEKDRLPDEGQHTTCRLNKILSSKVHFE